MPPPPVRNDADCRKRMHSLAVRLRALACPADQIPPALIAEADLLRAYIRRRVAKVTAQMDQDASSLLDTLDTTAAG